MVSSVRQTYNSVYVQFEEDVLTGIFSWIKTPVPQTDEEKNRRIEVIDSLLSKHLKACQFCYEFFGTNKVFSEFAEALTEERYYLTNLRKKDKET